MQQAVFVYNSCVENKKEVIGFFNAEGNPCHRNCYTITMNRKTIEYYI